MNRPNHWIFGLGLFLALTLTLLGLPGAAQAQQNDPAASYGPAGQDYNTVTKALIAEVITTAPWVRAMDILLRLTRTPGNMFPIPGKRSTVPPVVPGVLNMPEASGAAGVAGNRNRELTSAWPIAAKSITS